MNCNNKKYYGTFLLIMLLLILIAILKRNVLYPEYINQRENFIGINNIKKLLKKNDEDDDEDDDDEGENKRERFNNDNESEYINNQSQKAYINKEIKRAIANINIPEGVQGPVGPHGPSGGVYQNKGYLTSKSNINEELKPIRMASALKPIGNLGSPILLNEAEYSSDKKWMMNADGTITNQYLGNKYCLSLNEDLSTDYGKYSLLELVDSRNGKCTQFSEDNNSRLKIKNSNNCMTIKNTSKMNGLNLSIPNIKKCNLSDISNSECKLEDNTEILGIDICNDIIKPEQTFIWM
jgi:hypothetical protein